MERSPSSKSSVERIQTTRSYITLALPDGSETSPMRAGTAAVTDQTRGREDVLVIHFALSPFGSSPLLTPFIVPPDSIPEPSRKGGEPVWLSDSWSNDIRELPPGMDGTAESFLFFPVPPDAQDLAGATLVLRFVDAADGTCFDVRLPLGGLESEELPARPWEKEYLP